ncbi:MAG: response regulator [Agarilytica sp.]
MLSLLLLEDDITLAKVTKKALEKRGFVVTHVANLADARAVLETTHFDNAVLDLKLESETSLSLIPLLREKNSEMRVLVLTAYASIATAVEAVKLGANNYLPKPANVSEIIQALESQTENEEQSETVEEDSMPMSPKRLEWEHIQRVLLKNDGNVSATARELNMHRRTLQRKLQKKPVKD